jgi:hypothetical protein
MFNSKPTYLMEISGEVHYPLESMRQKAPDFAALSEDDQRAALAASLVRQVMAVAEEEIRRRGMKPKRSIKGGGNERKTGSEIFANQLGEHHFTFAAAFEGDYDRAVAAVDQWVDRVSTFGGVASIGRVSLRGTDGTNLHKFDEQTESLAASLDDETLAAIDKLMEP